MKYVFTAILLLCGILSGADKLTEKGINREVNKLFSKRKPSKKDMPDLKKAETLLADLLKYEAEVKSTRDSIKGRGAKKKLQAKLEELEAKFPLQQRIKNALLIKNFVLFGKDTAAFRKKLFGIDGLKLDFKKPVVKRFDTLLTMLIAIGDYEAQNLPAENLKKHSTADYYPGAPEKSERESGSFKINTDIPGRHFTGYYAAPGEVVIIQLPESACNGKLTVLVGAHSDSNLPRTSMSRFPKIVRTFKVEKPGSIKVANSFGGLIYIQSTDKKSAAGLGEIEGKVSNACKAPYFIHGKTTAEEWQKIRQYDAPWAEIESSHLIYTVPSKSIRNLENPQELMDRWVEIVKAQDDLAGYTEKRTHAERIVFDKQISAGSLHAGYPIMGHIGQEVKALDLEVLNDKGNWGIFHELGHNHQRIFPGGYNNFWTFDTNIEVTVNIYSAYTYFAVLKKPVQAHEYWKPEDLAANLTKNFKAGKKYEEQENRTRALFFVHLVREFGWDLYKKMFREYWKHPKEGGPKSDLEERTLFLEICSKTTGKNLSRFFDTWGLEYDKSVLEKIKDLPAFSPSVKVN